MYTLIKTEGKAGRGQFENRSRHPYFMNVGTAAIIVLYIMGVMI